MAGTADIAALLKDTTNIKLTTAEAKELTEDFFKVLRKAIVTDQKVIVRDFGTFKLVHKEACEKRNPATGAKVNVPAKNVIKFKATPLPVEKKAAAKKAAPAPAKKSNRK